jgi:outer membrane protein TolC
MTPAHLTKGVFVKPVLVLIGTYALLSGEFGSELRAQIPFGSAAPNSAGSQQNRGPTQPLRLPSGTPSPESSPFSGSILSNEGVSPTALLLSLLDAIQRGLKQNLGLILGSQNTRLARAEELRKRSELLPDLTGRITNTVQQVNLAAFGIKIPFPGVNNVVGPFNIFDARAYLTQSILDLQAINNRRAASQGVRAAELTYKDSRDLVVLLIAGAYLQGLADSARVDEARAEVNTAEALYQKASDQLKAGIAPALDALRAQVELQSERTRLRQLENDYAKDKLGLARIIGLPLGQEFTLADKIPYAPLASLRLTDAMDRALRSRSDYQGAEAQVKSAEFSKRAAVSERLPTVGLNADYGDIGPNPLNSHGTFSVSASVKFSIWEGGRIRGDIEQADAQLQQRKAELADLRGKIEYEVRAALLDVQTATDQVEVARSAVELARRALEQAQDRFAAGVADNIEVVQAQNAVATAASSYIDSLFAHNISKTSLARALGIVEEAVTEYLKGK